jgi:5'-3' exonuclease
MAQLGNHTNIPLDEGLFRHMVINSIRGYKQKFGDQYGEIVIACDDRNYWRKQVFPYYKANRKKARDKSELDWTLIFESFNKIRSELKEFFPYRVIQIESAEADDIIATLVKNNLDKKIMILSGDKDFVQLHKHPNVKQYDPVRKKAITHDNPTYYLFEHIMKGDTGDGIPNVLSDDDTFVIESKRQKPLAQKKIDAAWIEKQVINERNYMRNKQIVDLDCIPSHISEAVVNKYNEEAGKDRSKLFNYFLKYKLKHMMENVGDF